MGSFCSTAAEKDNTSNSSDNGDDDIHDNSDDRRFNEGARTSTLFRDIFNMATPLTHRLLSKMLMENFTILRKEKPIKEKFSPDLPVESLPIHSVELDFEDLIIVEEDCIEREKKLYPDFDWPPGENDTGDLCFDDMIIIDLVKYKFCMRFAKDIEISHPMLELPFGVTGNIEIGSNHESIEEAFIQFEIPKLRIWYIHGEVKTAYVAFWGRPDLTPNISTNADFGNGDTFKMTFTERGSLDNIVEKILSKFGPKELVQRDTNAVCAKISGIGDRIMNAILKIVSVFLPDAGTRGPFAMDMRETIESGVASVLDEKTKVRSTSEIKADIKLLEMELSEAVEKEKENTNMEKDE